MKKPAAMLFGISLSLRGSGSSGRAYQNSGWRMEHSESETLPVQIIAQTILLHKKRNT